MRNVYWFALTFGVLLVVAGGCQSAGRYGPSSSGRLLIVGGGLRDDNAAIYGRFIELAGKDAVIGIVPTATGEESRGRDTFEIIQKYARPDQRVVIVPLFKEDVRPAGQATGMADADEVVARIDACQALWFVGGDQSRILRVFRPRSPGAAVVPVPGDSAAYFATLDLLDRGGVIAGTSAGAAMMTDPMITGGSSENALKLGAARASSCDDDPQKAASGVGLAPGMGYWTHARTDAGPARVLVDQHFTQRNRFGRLWVAMSQVSAHVDDRPRRSDPGFIVGFGIPEDCAVEVNLRDGTIQHWGKEPIVELRRSVKDITTGTPSPFGVDTRP